MTPAGPRTDHELILSILDKMDGVFLGIEGLSSRMENFRSVLFGAEGDSHDIGLIARVKAIEDEDYDKRLEVIEAFINGLRPLIKIWIAIMSLLGASIVALIFEIISGRLILVIP